MRKIIYSSTPFEKILPKKYGHSAFYVKVQPQLWLRVYEIEHLFSSVGAAHMYTLRISFRHLHKLKHLDWGDRKTIDFDCEPCVGNSILMELKQKGKVDISYLFEG